MPATASLGAMFGFGRAQSSQNQIVYSNLQIWLDSGNVSSYPGSGTVWSNLFAANSGTYWYTLSNGPPLVSTIVYNGTSNRTLYFDGTNDYATPNTSLKTLAQANNWNETREYWLYWPGSPGCLTMESGTVTPDSNWYDAQIGLSNGNLAYAVWADMTAKIVTSTLTSNAWNHIVFQHSKSSNLLMGYVNGVLLLSNGSVTRTTPDSVGAEFFPILMAGSATNFGYGSASYLAASLGVFRWYNQILTSSMVVQNYNAERARFGSSLSSGASVLAFARTLSAQLSGQTVAPTSGGRLSLNSQFVGNYDYTAKTTTTISAFTASDWFSSTEDTASAWIVVNGNLTINAGVTFTPSVRKLFTVLYVSGNLVCNGTISMTARGANHSGTGNSGGATTAVDIRIGTGTFSAVANPAIPAAGGAGGPGTSTDNGISNGTAGSSGGTGGGGAGGKYLGTGFSGAGAAGTCFSGGSGGGGMFSSSGTAGAGVANGGRGGSALNNISAGGSGNPGGTGTGGANGPDGNVGTGGTLIVIVGGTFSGTGAISANGVASARASGQVGGGGSGGGSVTILFGTDSSSITPTATGGPGSSCGGGGNGTARKLAIGAN